MVKGPLRLAWSAVAVGLALCVAVARLKPVCCVYVLCIICVPVVSVFYYRDYFIKVNVFFIVLRKNMKILHFAEIGP